MNDERIPAKGPIKKKSSIIDDNLRGIALVPLPHVVCTNACRIPQSLKNFIIIIILNRSIARRPMLTGKKFSSGSYLFIEGEEDSSHVYLVKKGRVKHVCSSPELSAALKDAGDGDFAGFISAFSGRPRLSSAVAVEDTVAVRIGSEQLFSMLAERKEIAMKIMNSYSHALQRHDSILMGIRPISLLYPPGLSMLKLGEYCMEKGDNTLASYIFNRYVQHYPDSENIERAMEYACALQQHSSGGITETENGELLYDDGAVIFCEHEPGDNLYFIEEGRIKITKQSGSSDMLLAVLGPGEIFGELALITSSPRSATAVSFGGTRVRPINTEEFMDTVTESPELTRRIITSISHRLWFNHVRLGQMSYRKPVTRLFAFLETKLMEEMVSLNRKTPYQLQIGLDELIRMNELSPDEHMDGINELVANSCLSFNFGTITVLNPRQFAADVKMYKQRDSIPVVKKRKPYAAGLQAAASPDTTGEYDSTSDISIETATASPGTHIQEEVTTILPGLASNDPSVRVNAVIRLGSLGEKAIKHVPLLRERLGDNVKVIRRNAARSIMNILPPGDSFRVLSDALQDDSQEMRSAAAAGLAELHIAEKSGIIDLLIKSLGDWSPMVRSSAVRSLGYMGTEASRSGPQLIRLLSDNESAVRILAVNALEKVTGQGGYINEVINAVRHSSRNDSDSFVRASAREALIKLNRRKKSGNT